MPVANPFLVEKRKRNRKLFLQWKAAGAETAPQPELDTTADPEGDGKATRRRKTEMRLELEATLSPDELLMMFAQADTDRRQAKEMVASARTKKEAAADVLRSRDRHWRVVVGVIVLSHAAHDSNFRREIDGIFTRRIADKDRALLARWRDQHATATTPQKTDDAPPKTDDAILVGWVPRKLADMSWGALRKPPGKDLPPDLVGRDIKVTPRTGDAWVTNVVEIVKANDKEILVRHAGRSSFPPPAGSTPATPASDAGGDGAGTTEETSPSSGTENTVDPAGVSAPV